MQAKVNFIKIQVVLAVLLSLFGETALSAEPSSKSCNYYFDVEDYYRCGRRGYPLNFGYRLCHRYLQAEPRLSKPIREWFPKIRLCLQEFIADEYGSIRDCRDLKQRSIDSHIPCYVKTGFCSLEGKDVFKIIQITSIDIFNPDVLSMSMKVLQKCSAINKTKTHFTDQYSRTSGL
jgi:hypothetical protein